MSNSPASTTPSRSGSGRAVSEQHELVVSRKFELAEGIAGFELSAPNGDPLPWWDPGAHIDVYTPSGVVRQYSLCGDFGIAKTWRIGVLRELHGRGGSESLHLKTEVDDRLIVSVPRNNFPLAPASSYLFLAGGIGITPILSMVKAATARGADWHLVYGGRKRESMAFLSELEGFSADQCTVMVEHEDGVPDFAALLGGLAEGTQVYCCGPSGMIAALEAAGKHHPGIGIHIERFVASDLPTLEAEPNEPFEVVLGSTGEKLEVGEDETLLEVLSRRGVSTVSSCLEGLCGTCEIGVIAGTPLHRDSILTEEERASGKWMMPCVSRCVGRSLTIDVTAPAQ